MTTIRLVVQGTIEDVVTAMHEKKRALAAAITGATGEAGSLSTDKLIGLLREGHFYPRQPRLGLLPAAAEQKAPEGEQGLQEAVVQVVEAPCLRVHRLQFGRHQLGHHLGPEEALQQEQRIRPVEGIAVQCPRAHVDQVLGLLEGRSAGLLEPGGETGGVVGPVGAVGGEGVQVPARHLAGPVDGERRVDGLEHLLRRGGRLLVARVAVDEEAEVRPTPGEELLMRWVEGHSIGPVLARERVAQGAITLGEEGGPGAAPVHRGGSWLSEVGV